VNALFEAITKWFSGAKFFVIVQPWESAVRTRLGKNARILASGLHWLIPFADEVRRYNNRVRFYPIPTFNPSTRDGKTLTIGGLISFSIIDPLAASMAVSEPETCAAAIAQSEVARLITAADSVASIEVEKLCSYTARVAQSQLPGVQVHYVRLVDFAQMRTLRLLQEQWRLYTDRDKQERA